MGQQDEDVAEGPGDTSAAGEESPGYQPVTGLGGDTITLPLLLADS